MAHISDDCHVGCGYPCGEGGTCAKQLDLVPEQVQTHSKGNTMYSSPRSAPHAASFRLFLKLRLGLEHSPIGAGCRAPCSHVFSGEEPLQAGWPGAASASQRVRSTAGPRPLSSQRSCVPASPFAANPSASSWGQRQTVLPVQVRGTVLYSPKVSCLFAIGLPPALVLRCLKPWPGVLKRGL